MEEQIEVKIKKNELEKNKIKKKEFKMEDLSVILFGIFQSFVFNLNEQIRNKNTIQNSDKYRSSQILL